MEYLIHIAILVALYGMLGLSLNLVMGETGLLSVTHAAFYGIGAYVAALLLVNFHMNFFVAVLVGIVASGFAALLVGLVFSRFKGDYYALGSLGFGVIVYSIFLNWQQVTNGPLGIPGIPRPELLGVSFFNNISFLVLALLALALVYGTSVLIKKSSFGRVIQAIREDEEVTAIFGYSTLYFKLVIFVISAALASIAGALFASYLYYIDPSSFTVNESIFILSVVILGGLASNRGVLLGAFLLVVLPEALRFVGFPSDIAAQMRQLVYGLALILLMLFRPQGLLGKYRL
jgi:branched-chain amino acid transport system permease protein